MRRIIKSHDVSMGLESALISAEVAGQTRNDGAEDGGVDLAAVHSEERARTAGEKIVKEAQDHAKQIKQTAEFNAAKMTEETRAKCDALEKQTREDAHKQGYDEGYGKGAAEARSLQDEAQRTLSDAVKTRKEMIDGAEPEIVELIIKLSKKIIGGMAELNPKLIQILIKRAMSEISTIGGVKVRVSEADFAVAQSGRNEFLALVEGGADVEVIKDLSLGKTDCIIETPYGSVDCSLDGQLEQLKESLYFIYREQ